MPVVNALAPSPSTARLPDPLGARTLAPTLRHGLSDVCGPMAGVLAGTPDDRPSDPVPSPPLPLAV